MFGRIIFSGTLFLSFFIAFNANCQDQEIFEYSTTIPTTGNSWVINNINKTSSIISSEGITNWSDPDYTIRTYFYLEKPSKVSLAINAKVESRSSEIELSFGSETKKISLSNKALKTIYIGDYQIDQIGYHFIDIRGIKKSKDTFAEIKEILLNQKDGSSSIKFIKDDFYFGRRGPSTHLVYQIPEEIDKAEWFYNEIEIDEYQDVVGSYFMANGFSEGYFGIQVNSPTERRILFSIWSPYKTDNPKDIPEEYRITLLKRGEGVSSGKFGNEGSGGQSYKVFNWKAKTRYGFLVRVKPTGGNSTDYTAYFYDPDVKKWSLIASFRRPKTDTYLKRPYSFLENFIPNTGAISRKGGYFNQWVCDADGNWHEINIAEFSADATARKDARMDYSGGVENQGFYLKNCGFTNEKTKIGTRLIRDKLSKKPVIDFSILE